MSENLRVDRYLENQEMDHIDHALGRPLDPLGETYRNYYATGSQRFDGNPHWTLVEVSKGGTRIYSVTDEGRQALAEYLKASGSKHRAFLVTVEIDGVVDERPVVAKDEAEACYGRYLDIIDALPDLTFDEFCRCATWSALEPAHG
ncbi:MAG: hypothetical protein H6R00_193 [Proteobacteria bacterium]|nr:hypothetical protein [Pseudomonadota bacterium]